MSVQGPLVHVHEVLENRAVLELRREALSGAADLGGDPRAVLETLTTLPTIDQLRLVGSVPLAASAAEQEWPTGSSEQAGAWLVALYRALGEQLNLRSLL